MPISHLDIKGRDKTAQAFNSIKGRMNGLDRSVSKLSRGFGALAGGAAAAALTGIAKTALDSADKIQKLTISTGASAEALSQYRHAADLSGISFDTFATALKKMNNGIGEASQGVGTAKVSLDALGISVSQLQSMSVDEQFEFLADAINGVKSPAEQTAIAMDLFGRSGVDLLPMLSDGSAGLLQMRAEADSLGMTMSQDMVNSAADANDAMTKFGNAISGSVTQSVLKYSGEIESAANFLSNALPRAIDLTVNAFNLAIPAVAGFYSTTLLLKFAPPLFTAIGASAVAMGGGMSAASIAMGVATAAASGLKIALAFLGGPVGVLALVVGGLAAYYTNASNAKTPTSELKAELDKLTASTKNLTEAQAAQRLQENAVRLADLREEYERLKFNVAVGAVSIANLTEAMKPLDAREKILMDTQEELTKSIRDASGAFKDESEEVVASTKVLNTLTGVVDEVKKAKFELATATKMSFAEFKNAGGATGGYTDALERAKDSLNASKSAQFQFDQALKSGAISGELAAEVAKEMGVEYGELGNTVTTVKGLWERANDSMFNSLQSFFSSGLKDTKAFSQNLKDTFKDMISSLLAEITRLIASNVFKKFLGFLGIGGTKNQGIGLFDGLGSFFGDTKDGQTGGFDLSSIVTSLTGIGTKVSGAITSLFGGTAAASGVAVGGAASAGAAMAAALASAGSAGVAVGGAAGAGAAMNASLLAAGTGGIGSSIGAAISAIPGWGWAALAAAAVLSIGSGARTPQELGEDQLRAVDEATKAGRNTQVQLGSVSGISTAFLGGFDENSTFFGVDLAKEELQKVGDILTSKFGFNQALALKDGVIRLEDFSRDFSKNNEEIVAEVQASIAIAKLAFEDAEGAKLAALGGTLIEFDRVYDSMAGKGLSTADQLTQAYMKAFGATEDVATSALANIGLSTERMAEIFGTASNEVLATMTGVATDGLGLFGQAINDLGANATTTFDAIEQRIQGVSNSAVSGSQQVENAYTGAVNRAESNTNSALNRLADRLKEFVDNSSVTRGAGQPLAGM